MQPTDIRNEDVLSKKIKVDGRKLVTDTWLNKGILNGNSSLIESFYDEYPTVNLAKLSEIPQIGQSLSSCVGDVTTEIPDINTKFRDCMELELPVLGQNDIKETLDRGLLYKPLPDFKYKRFRDGPKFTVDVSSIVNPTLFTESEYYNHNLQNIYAENFKNGGLGNRQNCNTNGCPTEECDQQSNYNLDFERRQMSQYRLPIMTDQSCAASNQPVCTIVESTSEREENVGYTFDEKQRLQWKLIDETFIDLPVYNIDSDQRMLSLGTVVENFFAKFDNPEDLAEMAVEIDETCPAQAALAPVFPEDNSCVVSFQETTLTKCAAGFFRTTLVQDVTGLVDDTGVSMALRLYWNFNTNEWGKPNPDNYDPTGVDFDIGLNQPTTDYETRYAIFNPTGLTGNDMLKLLCRCELPVSKIVFDFYR